MNDEVLYNTQIQIHKAYNGRDYQLLNIIHTFVMNEFIVNLTTAYREYVNRITPVNVRFKTMTCSTFEQDEIMYATLKVLDLSRHLHYKRNELEFVQLKIALDKWFYETSEEGMLMWEYPEENSVSIFEASVEFRTDKVVIYNRLEDGLETLGAKDPERIPKFIIQGLKSHFAGELQSIFLSKARRRDHVMTKLYFINQQINEFMRIFKGSYRPLFGALTDEEIGMRSNADFIFHWKDIEERREELLNKLTDEH